MASGRGPVPAPPAPEALHQGYFTDRMTVGRQWDAIAEEASHPMHAAAEFEVRTGGLAQAAWCMHKWRQPKL